MQLKEIIVRPVQKDEEVEYQKLMQEHHYLGLCPKIGESLWYVAVYRKNWLALISFSSAALRSKARDEWIGWNYRVRFGRLKLIINNSRFLILPDFHYPNVGSCVLSKCLKRVGKDWLEIFGHRILLAETFVDPQRFHGTIYKAANWEYIGNSKGFSRVSGGYSSKTSNPKMMFVSPLHRKAGQILSQTTLNRDCTGGEIKMNLEADTMKALPDFFKPIKDPRRDQGKRHKLSSILSIVAGATLCGMEGYKGFSDWAQALGQKTRERFQGYRKMGKYLVPWNAVYGEEDESLAIDGKTMCNAIGQDGRQTHIMSAMGHKSKICLTQKK